MEMLTETRTMAIRMETKTEIKIKEPEMVTRTEI